MSHRPYQPKGFHFHYDFLEQLSESDMAILNHELESLDLFLLRKSAGMRKWGLTAEDVTGGGKGGLL